VAHIFFGLKDIHVPTTFLSKKATPQDLHSSPFKTKNKALNAPEKNKKYVFKYTASKKQKITQSWA
jgi:hypothetical protein